MPADVGRGKIVDDVVVAERRGLLSLGVVVREDAIGGHWSVLLLNRPVYSIEGLQCKARRLTCDSRPHVRLRDALYYIVLHCALELWTRVGCNGCSVRAKRAAATPERLRVHREKNRPAPCRNFPRKNETSVIDVIDHRPMYAQR